MFALPAAVLRLGSRSLKLRHLLPRPALGEKGWEGVAAVLMSAEAGDWVTCPSYTASEHLSS